MSYFDQARAAAEELVRVARPHFNPVALLAVGASSSEIAGGIIGQDSSYEIGEQVVDGLLAAARDGGFDLAFQCCEHLNRALVVERRVALAVGAEIVCVVPHTKAGGSLATAAYARLQDPVVVECVRADAGLDIGRTMIGMHLRPVAVPVRLQAERVGEAIVIAARTRPRLIGGERARYAQNEG
ncbi:MAG: TIGR01440 family protein [Christensenellales bacterium]|jgi:uncharacterized protein (TIGR01440 family)